MPRRNNRRGDGFNPQGDASERIARELVAERLGRAYQSHTTMQETWSVGIASLDRRAGIAFVKEPGAWRSVKVTWGPRHWNCAECGRFDGPDCQHARLIVDSPELRRAYQVRGLKPSTTRRNS